MKFIYRIPRLNGAIALASRRSLFEPRDGLILFAVAAMCLGQVKEVSSRDDLLAGFVVGILARGGRRLSASHGPSSGNVVDLRLRGLRVSTPDVAGAADLVLQAAFIPETATSEYFPGDNNAIRVLMTGATGSGPRQNVYATTSGPAGPLQPEYAGANNRLEFIGSRQAFDTTNEAIEPAPPELYFLGGY